MINTITLNQKQTECIETLVGSVMVLAGPGTGKTFTIIQRLKSMLTKGIKPNSILCLTFSETAANEIKLRLVKEIGSIASGVNVHTYHAFCNEIIIQNPSQFEMLEGVSIIDDISKWKLLKEAIDESNLVYYKTQFGDSYHFKDEFLKIVSELKQNRVTKESYFHILKTHSKWYGKLNEFEQEYIERKAKDKLVKTFIEKYEAHKRKIGKAEEA